MWCAIIHILFPFYRPLLFLCIALITSILGAVLMPASYIFPGGWRTYWIGTLWARIILRLSCISIAVNGRHHIDPRRSYIVMSNHQSHYDVLALVTTLPLQLRWVIKKELRTIPVFGLGCERLGHIYIDRSNPEKARQSLKTAEDKIRNGASITFFPEGTRSPDGNLLPFKKGGFVIALATQTPILPVTITGSRRILPKKSLRVVPGKITVMIHEPVSISRYTNDTKESLIKHVRSCIEAGRKAGGLTAKKRR